MKKQKHFQLNIMLSRIGTSYDGHCPSIVAYSFWPINFSVSRVAGSWNVRRVRPRQGRAELRAGVPAVQVPRRRRALPALSHQLRQGGGVRGVGALQRPGRAPRLRRLRRVRRPAAVSYTHLTLPTIYSV